MDEYEKVSELLFGEALIRIDNSGDYPLSRVTLYTFTDDKGDFYLPCVREINADIPLVAGSDNGYERREDALACAGRCWDMAEAAEKKKYNTLNNPVKP